MNFKQFLEIADLVNRDTSNVRLKKNYPNNVINSVIQGCLNQFGNDYEAVEKCKLERIEKEKPSDFEYNFEVGGKEFQVKLIGYKKSVMTSSHFGQKMLEFGVPEDEIKRYFENVYYVDFMGPSGHKTTGNNQSASGVYGQVLLALKKLSEEYGLEGLVFSAYEPSMSLIYNRFMKSFTDFEIVDHNNGIYLSKRLLDDMTRKYPNLATFIHRNARNYDDALRITRQAKVQGRKNSELFQNMVGKAIAVMVDGRWCAAIVYGYDRLSVKVYYFNPELSIMSTTLVMLNDLGYLSDHPELSDDYHKLLNELLSTGLRVPGNMRPYVGPLGGT